jgi:hypothetical protein
MPRKERGGRVGDAVEAAMASAWESSIKSLNYFGRIQAFTIVREDKMVYMFCTGI